MTSEKGLIDVHGCTGERSFSARDSSGLSRSCRDPGHLATCDAAAAIDPHGLPALAWALIRHADGAPGRGRDLAAPASVCLRTSTVFVPSALRLTRTHVR